MRAQEEHPFAADVEVSGPIASTPPQSAKVCGTGLLIAVVVLSQTLFGASPAWAEETQQDAGAKRAAEERRFEEDKRMRARTELETKRAVAKEKEEAQKRLKLEKQAADAKAAGERAAVVASAPAVSMASLSADGALAQSAVSKIDYVELAKKEVAEAQQAKNKAESAVRQLEATMARVEQDAAKAEKDYSALDPSSKNKEGKLLTLKVARQNFDRQKRAKQDAMAAVASTTRALRTAQQVEQTAMNSLQSVKVDVKKRAEALQKEMTTIQLERDTMAANVEKVKRKADDFVNSVAPTEQELRRSVKELNAVSDAAKKAFENKKSEAEKSDGPGKKELAKEAVALERQWKKARDAANLKETQGNRRLSEMKSRIDVMKQEAANAVRLLADFDKKVQAKRADLTAMQAADLKFNPKGFFFGFF